MPEDFCEGTDSNSLPAVKHWALYLVKAAALGGLLYLFAQHAGSLPPLAIALVWAALSTVGALGLTYHRVVRKTLKQYEYQAKGWLSRINGGRVICLVVAFVGSAVCMAGLMFELPKWGALEWVLGAAAIPVYLAVSLGVQRFVRGEIKPAFKAARVAAISSGIIAVVLIALGVALSLGEQPADTFASASEAFLAAPQPYENSPSVLMAQAGMVVALVDGFTAYGASCAAEASGWLYVGVKCLLVASAFGGIAGLLGVCSLELRELRRVFLPLEAAASPSDSHGAVKHVVVVAVLLPVALVGGYLGTDWAAARAVQTEEYTAAQRFVRDQVDLAVFVLDGAYYDYQSVQDLIAETQTASVELAQEAKATLVPLINASYDARLANVDAYLDWYYSLPADYERLVRLITGSVEEYVAQQFIEQIEAGVDDSELASQLQGYWDRASALKDNLMERLAGCEVADVPDWLPVTKDALEMDTLLANLESSQQLVSAGERMLVSAGVGTAAGVGTGMVAKQLVNKALASKLTEKAFFKVAVEKIGGMLASRTAGSVAGGAVGAIGGPVGVAAGVLAGGAVGVGVDYGLLKWDEAWNREGYRDEIVQTIEEARAEMLAAVE